MKQLSQNSQNKGETGKKPFLPIIAFANGSRKAQIFNNMHITAWQENMNRCETANKNWQPDERLFYKKIAKASPMVEERLTTDRSSVDLKPVMIGLTAIDAQSFAHKELAIAEYKRLLEMFAKNMERRNNEINIARNMNNTISEEHRFWQEFGREFESGRWRESPATMLSKEFRIDLVPLFVYDLCVKLGVQAEMVLFADRVAVRTKNNIIDRNPEKKNCYKIRLMDSDERNRLHFEGGLPRATSHIYVLIGNDMLRKGDVTTALTLFFMAIKLYPKYAPAQNMAGMALYNLGVMEEAAKHFRKAISYAKEDSDRANSYYNLASACKFMDTPSSMTEGISACDSALKLNARYINAYIVKAELQHMSGKSDAALETCRQAIKLFPYFAEQTVTPPRHFEEIYRVMGNIYQEMGLRDLALRSFNSYKELGGKPGDEDNA